MTVNIPKHDIRAPSFWADHDAALYDELAGLTDPAYESLHENLTAQFVSWLASKPPSEVPANGILVLDAGCGTGKEAVGLLRADPRVHVLGIDVSGPMMDQCRRRLERESGDETASGRCVLVQSDVRDSDWLDAAMSRSLPSQWPTSLFAAVSAYALHHFSPPVKRTIYSDVHRHLRTGGALVNGDLFSFQTPWLATYAQTVEECWIESQMTAAAGSIGQYSVTDPAVWHRLKEQWLCHLRNENCPLPALRSHAASKSNKAEHSEQHLLADSGFDAVECTFRCGQSAILWAFKDGDSDERSKCC